MSEDGAGITAALVAFQAELPNIGKTSTAQMGAYAYAYADLADVSKVILPALAKVGICYVTYPIRTLDDKLILKAELRHVSGESIAADWPVPVGTPQTMGSSVTYGRRYCLLAMTGVAPAGEDDDAQLATKEHAKLARDTVKTPRKATRTASTRDETDVWSTVRPTSDIDGPGITEAQIRKIGALMREAGIYERVAALDYVASVIGRTVDSRRDLTRAEAGQVIDSLEPRPVETLDTGGRT